MATERVGPQGTSAAARAAATKATQLQKATQKANAVKAQAQAKAKPAAPKAIAPKVDTQDRQAIAAKAAKPTPKAAKPAYYPDAKGMPKMAAKPATKATAPKFDTQDRQAIAAKAAKPAYYPDAKGMPKMAAKLAPKQAASKATAPKVDTQDRQAVAGKAARQDRVAAKHAKLDEEYAKRAPDTQDRRLVTDFSAQVEKNVAKNQAAARRTRDGGALEPQDRQKSAAWVGKWGRAKAEPFMDTPDRRARAAGDVVNLVVSNASSQAMAKPKSVTGAADPTYGRLAGSALAYRGVNPVGVRQLDAGAAASHARANHHQGRHRPQGISL